MIPAWTTHESRTTDSAATRVHRECRRAVHHFTSRLFTARFVLRLRYHSHIEFRFAKFTDYLRNRIPHGTFIGAQVDTLAGSDTPLDRVAKRD